MKKKLKIIIIIIKVHGLTTGNFICQYNFSAFELMELIILKNQSLIANFFEKQLKLNCANFELLFE